MGGTFYHSAETNGFQYDRNKNRSNDKVNINETDKKSRDRDTDLIIEENTIYEIDRDCYERLKRQKKGNKDLKKL